MSRSPRTTYRITGYGGVMAADDLLAVSPLGRALLLRFFATHTDQVAQVEVRTGADELPELWATDLTAVTTAEVSFPAAGAPMARVLHLPSLEGIQAGRERVTVDGDRRPLHRGRLPARRRLGGA